MKGESSMELFGFQMGNMGHHNFRTWAGNNKAQNAIATATPLDSTISTDDSLEKNLMLTALSL